jgi:amino acid transporter
METSLNFKKEPFAILLATTIILLFVLALRPISNIDFQDKVMFSVPLGNMVWIIPCFLISFWLLYLVTKKFLYSKTATWINVIATVISTLLIVSVLYIGIDPTPSISQRHELVGNVIQLVTLLFTAVQFTYIGNLIFGLIKRKNFKQKI